MEEKTLKKILLASLSMLQISCSENVFSGLSSTSSDAALLIDARTALNNQDYQVAIDIILNQLSSEGQQKTEAKELLAGGYAGKCGLNFLDFIESLTSSATGTAFTLTAAPFVGAAVDPESCLLSLQTMNSIGPSASRTLSQNVFAAIAGMSLMGSATRLYTDNSPVNGNGSQDSVGISCSLTDAQVDHIILGFGFMSENFSSLGSSQLGSTSATFSDLMNLCSSLGTSCNVTSSSSITPALRTVFRKLLNTFEYGVGTVVTSGNPVTIGTACP